MEKDEFRNKLCGMFHQELNGLIAAEGIDSILDTPDYILSFHIIDHLVNLYTLKRLKMQDEELSDLG